MKRIPAFTVILLMAVAAVAGIASLPMLNVQYAPTPKSNSIWVSCSWQGASERVMEAEAISVLEGVLSGISGCTSISSVSNQGSGTVFVDFRKGTDMAAARFEVASRIRNSYSSLPDGVTYPSISLGTRGTGSRNALVYVIKSPLPSSEIEKFITNYMLSPISAVEGVDKVSFWGATPFELEVTFDSKLAQTQGITANDIASAFDTWFGTERLGIVEVDGNTANLKLRCRGSDDIGDIPVKNAGGRIIHLRDLAKWRYKESLPTSYFRLNGLNTVTLSIDASNDYNLLKTVKDVKDKMEELRTGFPEEISTTLNYDASEYVSSEIHKIYLRTLLCLLILLMFVFVTSRSWRYLFVIASTLAVNIFVAVVFYNLFKLPVHIYTLAGITVSLGIIIDNSIVMADHYSHFGNRKVFPAILGATATTIGALCVITLLPDNEKANLGDFSAVIMINLAVSLLTAYLFIPSLLDRFPTRQSSRSRGLKRERRVVRWNRFYERYITKGMRLRWVYVAALVAAFGVPLFLLPDEVAKGKPEENRNIFQKGYNAVMSWRPYADNRSTIDKIAGTSFAMFGKAIDRSDFHREPGRSILYVQAGMPEGCSVGQLNEVVKMMENYLSRFDEIDQFKTNIYSYDNAVIEVTFKPEYESTALPSELKSKVTSMAINFGGANWRVWGINDSYFNNNIVSNYKGHCVILKGYNYDVLSGYADTLIGKLKENRRVSGPEVMVNQSSPAGTEFHLGYDFEKMAALGINPYAYYQTLRSKLFDTQIRDIGIDGKQTRVVLRSSEKDDFDLWNTLNSQVSSEGVKVKLSEIGSIKKGHTALPIHKKNQSYEITVGFDFIGSYELAQSYTKKIIDEFNDEILDIGYKAESPTYGMWSQKSKMRYAGLILLVIAIIYVMCCVIFESFRLPLAVILMIPISFIGIFLVFGLSDFTFDQGGFAAFVMLSGIVVNAGIYVVNAFQGDKSGRNGVRKYVKAFNRKITAILLTVLSTILGLVPFLFDGPDEVFWFAFAVGTIGGMLSSVIALLVYFPVFALKRPRKE